MTTKRGRARSPPPKQTRIPTTENKETFINNITLESLASFASWVPATPADPALIFDIEADGLLDTVTKIHSIVIKDTARGLVFSAHTPLDLALAVKMLEEAPVIVAHNGIGYDVPVLEKLYGFKPKGKVFDTLMALRLLFGDGDDFKARDHYNIKKKTYALPPHLIGRHSLAAWGYRVGLLKGTYGETTDWKEWTPQMQAYCGQDVSVLEAVYAFIFNVGFSAEAVALEMAFAEIIQKQMAFGFPFDTATAEALYAELCVEREELRRELETAFPPEVKETVFVPQRNNKTKGYLAGVPVIKRESITFNPGSRKQIAKRLHDNFGWVPAEFTPTGEPNIDSDILKGLPYAEAKLLARWFDLAKIIGMIAEGDNGWLKMVTKEGRIHGRVNTNGAVTGRCTHSKPNLAQVPKKGELGKRCRACFAAPPGWVMVGADASGLELRMFGHFVARYDGGAYARIVTDGDVHTANQQAAGIPTRDDAKTFIYAFLYGAGDMKLGSIVVPESSPKTQTFTGKRLRARFLSRLPALRRLVDGVKAAAKERGHLYGLDHRKLPVRSQHAALNVVLQSAGAVLVKFATVVWHMLIEEAGYEWGKDFAQVAHVHDEVQAVARPEIAEHLGALFVQAIELAGQHFNLRCPTTGEYKIGNNWKETH